jgi:hypothetical protein
MVFDLTRIRRRTSSAIVLSLLAVALVGLDIGGSSRPADAALDELPTARPSPAASLRSRPATRAATS